MTHDEVLARISAWDEEEMFPRGSQVKLTLLLSIGHLCVKDCPTHYKEARK